MRRDPATLPADPGLVSQVSPTMDVDLRISTCTIADNRERKRGPHRETPERLHRSGRPVWGSHGHGEIFSLACSGHKNFVTKETEKVETAYVHTYSEAPRLQDLGACEKSSGKPNIGKIHGVGAI